MLLIVDSNRDRDGSRNRQPWKVFVATSLLFLVDENLSIFLIGLSCVGSTPCKYEPKALLCYDNHQQIHMGMSIGFLDNRAAKPGACPIS